MIRSAAVMLRQHGVRGTSFGRVLDHSGAPRGSISHHFPGGKDEMIREAVTTAADDIAASLRGLVDSGATASQVVRAMCDYFARGLVATDYRAGCPVAAVAYEAYDNETLRTAASAALHQWHGLLAHSLDRLCDETRAGAYADLCIAAIEGAILTARLNRTTGPVDSVRDTDRKSVV